MPVKTSDTVLSAITELHDDNGMSFRQIAALPSYDPIPFSTIVYIYHGGRVPNKWRYKFDMPQIIKVRSDMVRKTAPRGTGKPRKRAARVEIALSDPVKARAKLEQKLSEWHEERKCE